MSWKVYLASAYGLILAVLLAVALPGWLLGSDHRRSLGRDGDRDGRARTEISRGGKVRCTLQRDEGRPGRARVHAR